MQTFVQRLEIIVIFSLLSRRNGWDACHYLKHLPCWKYDLVLITRTDRRKYSAAKKCVYKPKSVAWNVKLPHKNTHQTGFLKMEEDSFLVRNKREKKEECRDSSKDRCVCYIYFGLALILRSTFYIHRKCHGKNDFLDDVSSDFIFSSHWNVEIYIDEHIAHDIYIWKWLDDSYFM